MAAVFAERRQRVLEAMGPDAVAILLGARRVARSRGHNGLVHDLVSY